MTNLVKADRTYSAFAVDLVLFSVFQPIILKRVRDGERDVVDFVPWVGLGAWLFHKAGGGDMKDGN